MMNPDEGPIVQTTAGSVRGLRHEDLEQFLEVPYGASPAGERRFLPPEPVAQWAGVRDATAWTTRAPQNPDVAYGNAPKTFYAIQGDFYAQGMAEDCLTLNIWTPSTTDGVRRPVVFWIHGGGYTVGHAGSESYDGQRFARDNDVVFVSVTHRLNAFGFLYLGNIAGPDYEQSGNAGMLDIVLALRWVRDNIDRFGGDPQAVTIIGESGGGAKVSLLMVMDAADGLFHRAVCQSGIAQRANTLEQAEAYTDAILAQFDGDLSRLRQAPMEQILAADAAVARSGETRVGPGPVIDGRTLTDQPAQIWSQGGGSAVPLLAGWTHDELTIFATPDLDLDIEAPVTFRHGFGKDLPRLVDPDAGLSGVRRFLGGRSPDSLVAAVRASRPDLSDSDLAIAISGILVFQWPAVKLAETRAGSGQVTYLYEFDWVSPHLVALGAPHSSDIGLFFGNVDQLYATRGFPTAASASAAMSTALAAFARNGDPNTEGHSGWEPYSPQDRAVMVFGDAARVVEGPDPEVRRAIEDLDPAGVL